MSFIFIALKSRREYKYLSLKTQTSFTIFLKKNRQHTDDIRKKIRTLEQINRLASIAIKTRFIPFISYEV